MLLCLDLVALVRYLQFADLDKLRSKEILIHRTAHPVLKDSLRYDLYTLAYAEVDQTGDRVEVCTQRAFWELGFARSATGARNAELVIARGRQEPAVKLPPRGWVNATYLFEVLKSSDYGQTRMGARQKHSLFESYKHD
jgi:hypothetical protein